jgi:hypothetical protein
MQQIRTKEGVVDIIKVTKDNFIVPKGEERSYHCLMQEKKKYNDETGEYVGKVRIQAFGKKFFENGGLHNLRTLGYDVTILHDPNEWEKANGARIAAEQAAKEKESREAAEKAAAEKRKADKAAMKAEILAELREQGIIPEQKAAAKPKAKK